MKNRRLSESTWNSRGISFLKPIGPAASIPRRSGPSFNIVPIRICPIVEIARLPIVSGETDEFVTNNFEFITPYFQQHFPTSWKKGTAGYYLLSKRRAIRRSPIHRELCEDHGPRLPRALHGVIHSIPDCSPLASGASVRYIFPHAARRRWSSPGFRVPMLIIFRKDRRPLPKPDLSVWVY